MTKTSIYCYEQNGGRCRNKVSPANNFICGAGHGKDGQDGSVSSRLSVTAPVINLSRMDDDQKYQLGRYLSTSPELLDELAKNKNWYVRKGVAGNTSASPDTHIYLAEQGHPVYGFARGKSIDELIKDIHLVDRYPGAFGMAYLSRLAYSFTPEDETHPKRRALIGYVYAKFAESGADDWMRSNYKEHIKARFPDDQEMAEIIGY